MPKRFKSSDLKVIIFLIAGALIFDIITLTQIGPMVFFILIIIILLSLFSKVVNKVSAKNENQKYEAAENLLDKIDYMSGQEFEQILIKDLLPKNGYININGTPYTGDYGVDIIAEKNGIKCAIQCKRANSKITNKAIQEIVAGKKHYKCEKAIVISNNYFTRNACELAFDNKVELLDRDDLIKMIKNNY